MHDRRTYTSPRQRLGPDVAEPPRGSTDVVVPEAMPSRHQYVDPHREIWTNDHDPSPAPPLDDVDVTALTDAEVDQTDVLSRTEDHSGANRPEPPHVSATVVGQGSTVKRGCVTVGDDQMFDHSYDARAR